MPQRDSLGYTIGVATVLCVICSLAVSAAAVALRPLQEANKVLDQQKNILDAAGLALGEYGRPASELDSDQIKGLYELVSEKFVDLDSGEYVTGDTDGFDPETYDTRKAVKDLDMSIEITEPDFDIGVPRREKIAKVYFVNDPDSGQLQQVVLPVYGKGLWSTLYGYLALKNDLKTIQGLTFYQHAETPGLGGEVDNTKWKAQWVGNLLYSPEGNIAAGVAKGPAPAGSQFLVDGLSGATITSRGVTNLVRYWAGPNGYGPFLERLETQVNAVGGSADAEIPQPLLPSGVQQYDRDTAVADPVVDATPSTSENDHQD